MPSKPVCHAWLPDRFPSFAGVLTDVFAVSPAIGSDSSSVHPLVIGTCRGNASFENKHETVTIGLEISAKLFENFPPGHRALL